MSRDLRMVPLAVGGWVAAWLGTWGTIGGWAVAGTGVVIISVVAVVRRSVYWTAAAVVVAMLAVVGGAGAHRLSHGPVARLATSHAVVTAEVVIRTDASVSAGTGVRASYATSRALMTEISGRGTSWRLRQPVLVVVSGEALTTWSALPVGSRVAIAARLDEPDRGADVAAIVRVRGTPQLRDPPGAGLRMVERVRQGLRDAVVDRRPEPKALVPALVLGDTATVSPELTADFRTTGLTHLTAVSGANLTLLLAFLLTMARWVGIRGWWLRLVGLLGVLVFVALCRTEPSVLRAAAMGLVALAALGSGARRAGLRNLAVAMVVLLLLDPFLSRSIGFILSVLASGGIIGWARDWAALLNRWLPMVLAESVAVPLAAHLATLPVVASIAGTVSVVGLLANGLAGPFVGPATVLGFAAAAASLVSRHLAAVLGFGAAWSAQLIIWVAHAGARLPGASWQWPTSTPALVWLGVVAVGCGLVMTYVLARRWLTLLLAGVMVACLGGAPMQPGWPPADWVLVGCDVGQGDGLVLRAGGRSAVVFDSGPDPAAMRRCLDTMGIRVVPLLVLTHFHADHVDGLAGVFAGRRVQQVWVSPLPSPAYEALAVQRQAAAAGASVATPLPGTHATVGDVVLDVIGPVPHPTADEDESSVQNDGSLVVLAQTDGLRLLMTGDVEPAGQQAILATGADLRADVLKIPHHGSSRQDPAFFAATHARLAIASAGLHNDYGHPAPRTVQLVGDLGMTLLRTDSEGAVAVTISQGRLGAVTQRPAPR